MGEHAESHWTRQHPWLNTQSNQLADTSVLGHTHPTCFKYATIILVPKAITIIWEQLLFNCCPASQASNLTIQCSHPIQLPSCTIPTSVCVQCKKKKKIKDFSKPELIVDWQAVFCFMSQGALMTAFSAFLFSYSAIASLGRVSACTLHTMHILISHYMVIIIDISLSLALSHTHKHTHRHITS